MLPIIASPVEDELLYAYIHRLAKLNLLDVDALNGMFGFTGFPLKRDSSDYLLDFLAEAAPGTELNFFYSHTVFPGLFPFMSGFDQTRVIAQCFYRMPFRHRTNPFRTKSRIGNVRICPVCYEEEKENRFLFGMHTAYRSHNMPGVSVCHKHGCPLAASPAKGELPWDCGPASLSPLPVSNLDIDTETSYAVFCHDLLSMNLNTCLSEVSGVISSDPRSEFRQYSGLENVMRLAHAVFRTSDAFRAALFREYGEEHISGQILVSETCPDCSSRIVNSSYSRQFGFPCGCKSYGLSPEAYALHIAENIIGPDCRTDVMVRRGRICVKYTDEVNGFDVSGPFGQMLRFPEKYPKLAEKYRLQNSIKRVRRGSSPEET